MSHLYARQGVLGLSGTKSLIKAERLKEKLGKQDFHYDMEEVFEPVTENQKNVKTKPS